MGPAVRISCQRNLTAGHTACFLTCKYSPKSQCLRQPSPPRSLVGGLGLTASGLHSLQPAARPAWPGQMCVLPVVPGHSTCTESPDLCSAQTSGLVNISTWGPPKKASHFAKLNVFSLEPCFIPESSSLSWAVSLGLATIYS